MKIGVCFEPDRATLAVAAGYDYIECNFSRLANLDEETVRSEYALLEESGIAAEAFKNFFAPDMRFYDEEVNYSELTAYLERGLLRASRMGGKIAVIGSGKARNIPDGFDRNEAEARFARILAHSANLAERYGMRVVVEPLSKTETNFIHTVAEGDALRQLSEHPAVGDLVDFFHYYRNGDTPDGIMAAGEHLIHTHLARPNPDRRAPLPEDAPVLAEWARLLACAPGGATYAERISLECKYSENPANDIQIARPLMEIFRLIPVEGGTNHV